MSADKYSYSAGKCVVVTLEAVYPLQDGAREAEDVLEQLQQYGAARVMTRRIIADDFDAATKILYKRADAANKACK